MSRSFIVSLLCFAACPSGNGSSSGPSNGPTASGGSSLGTSSGGGSLTAAEFNTRLTTEVCTDVAPRCCTSAGFTTFATQLCDSDIATNFTTAASHATFQPGTAQACLNIFNQLGSSCDLTSVSASIEDDCSLAKIYLGTVAPGGACAVDADCATPSGDGVEAFSVCNTEDQGSSGGGSSGGGFCVTTTIATTVGAACAQSVSQGTPQDSECGAGLYCNNGLCASLVAAGGACTFQGQCQDGLYCDQTGNGTCVAELGVNSPCPQGTECQDALVCDTTPKCVSPLAAGTACDPNAAFAVCGNSAQCDATTMRCLSYNSLANDALCGVPQ